MSSQAIITEAVTMIAAERDRQIRHEGFTPEHDLANNQPRELIQAALEYTHYAAIGLSGHRPEIIYQCKSAPTGWPWAACWWKPTNPQKDLIKAAALLAAAVDLMLKQEEAANHANQ